MARKFFYICAAMFLLALSFNLGARSAGAQAPPHLVSAAVSSPPYEQWAVLGRRLYRMTGSVPVVQDTGEIPGTAQVVACGPFGVVLANGDVYDLSGGGGNTWALKGSFLGGAPPRR